MIKALARLIVALNANTRPAEIGAGAAFGLLLALVPGGNLLWIALFVAAFLIKMNLAATFLLLGLLRLIVPFVDPALDALGYLVLSTPALAPLFTALQNAPVVPWTRFNDTVVMGGFVAGLVLWVPVCLGFIALVKVYRAKLRERIAGSRLGRAIAKVPLFATLGKAIGAVGGTAGLGG
jgi:uncharacterized protein (TIGR03546 family)